MADSPLLVLVQGLRASEHLQNVPVFAGAGALSESEADQTPRIVVVPRGWNDGTAAPHAGGNPRVLWHSEEQIEIHLLARSVDQDRQGAEYDLDELFKLRERVVRALETQQWQGYRYTLRGGQYVFERGEASGYGEACAMLVEARLPITDKAKPTATVTAVSSTKRIDT
jgi:hypothetical protein